MQYAMYNLIYIQSTLKKGVSHNIRVRLMSHFAGPQHPGRDGDGRDGPGDKYE